MADRRAYCNTTISFRLVQIPEFSCGRGELTPQCWPFGRRDQDPAIAVVELGGEVVVSALGDVLRSLLVGFAGEQVFEGRLLGEVVLGFRRRIFLDEA